MNETIETEAFLIPGGCCGCGGALARNLLRDSYFVTNWNGLGTKCGSCLCLTLPVMLSFSPLSPPGALRLALAPVSSRVDLGIMIPAETSKLGIRKLCSDITVTCLRREDSVLKSSRCPSMRTEP